MIILGIDPGFGIAGYGVLSLEGNIFKHIAHGVVETTKNVDLSYRLKELYDDFTKLLETYKPNEVAIEKLFFSRNITTGIAVGEARGVLILASIQCGLTVFEYTPHQVKKAVTGQGRATKSQVQRMIKILLNLPETPRPDDAADALAIAWCHGTNRHAFLGEY